MAHLKLATARYAAADTMLGAKSDRVIGHNTRLGRRDDESIAVRYHATDIVTMRRDGWVIVSTGGWRTVTTMARVNGLLPGRWLVGSYGKRGSWLWSNGYPITPFVDGIAVHEDDGAVGFTSSLYSAPDVILTPDNVADIITAAEKAAEERDAKRAARLLREHAEHVAEIAEREQLEEKFAGREPIASDGARLQYLRAHTMTERHRWDGTAGQYVTSRVNRYHARTYGGRHWGCPECNALTD